MKDYQLCGLGNAIVDIFIELSDQEFAALGFERGTMRLVELEEQRALLKCFHDREPRLVSGGSVANSVIAFSQLGGQAAVLRGRLFGEGRGTSLRLWHHQSRGDRAHEVHRGGLCEQGCALQRDLPRHSADPVA